MLARLCYAQSLGLCVFDLDHTLLRTPLDLTAMAADMRRLIERERGPLPARPERYRVFEVVEWSKRRAPELGRGGWGVAVGDGGRGGGGAGPGPGAPGPGGGARRPG